MKGYRESMGQVLRTMFDIEAGCFRELPDAPGPGPGPEEATVEIVEPAVLAADRSKAGSRHLSPGRRRRRSVAAPVETTAR